jgi:cell division transport system permease protein
MSAYLARHAQVLVGSLGRLAQHPIAALMTMAVVAVALALPLFFGLLLENARAASGNWNDAFDIAVYMDKQGSETQAQVLAKELRQRGDVAAVRVISADQALAEFRKDSGFGEALDALTDNPLPDTLVVTPTLRASTSQGTDTLKEAIAAMSGVHAVQLDTDWVKRLETLLEILQRVVLIIGVLLGIGVLMIVGNTIRLDILNRRMEIEVMKLVGASNRFTRRPFLYAGMWYGLGGGLIALGLVTLAAAALDGPVHRLSSLYGSDFRLRGLGLRASLTLLGAAVGLSWVGSWVAATRHIQAIEPT